MSRSKSLLLAAIVLVACFLAASVGAYAGHTDDGCQVEMHCFACHWAFASAAVICLPTTIAVCSEPAGAVVEAEAALPGDPRFADLASRGPPLS
jgi:hypothetical protein